MFRQMALSLALAYLMILPATAQDFQKGKAAYERSDYAAALQEWKPLAEKGNPEAQRGLGLLYVHGRGVPKDYAKARDWFYKAAKQGYAKAQYDVGVMYLKGEGFRRDYAEAAKWFQEAAKQGEPRGQYGMGTLYSSGKGVAQDFAEAGRWYRLAAEQGDQYGQYGLGTLYANGWGVLRDPAEAAKWFRMAAVQGLDNAQFALGRYYQAGEGVPQDDAKAFKWFRKAAEQGHAKATLEVGAYYLKENNYVMSYMWFIIAAEKGESDAEDHLDLFQEYISKGQISAAEGLAQQWYAKHGIKPSQSLRPAKRGFGNFYRDLLARVNKGCKQGATESDQRSKRQRCIEAAKRNVDLEAAGMAAYFGHYGLAIERLRPHAKSGNLRVQEGLAASYIATRKYAEAAKWFKSLAKKGNDEMQYRLGSAYAKGLGVPQDKVHAYMLLSLSRHSDAKQELEYLVQDMTPAEIARGKELVEKWRKEWAIKSQTK